MNKLRTQNGITLIALVVTIVVLLILAAVSISMLAGEDGIVRNAQKAKDENEEKSQKEMIQLAVNAAMIGENGYGEITPARVEEELSKLTKESFDVGTGSPFTVKFGTNEYQVSENGNVTGPTKVPAGGSENLASVLYEDLAGDETGATEGKVHIGDYVNYNAIAQGDTGTEAKYQYPSDNDNTGITEAIAEYALTGFTDASQNFTAKSGINWVVLGIEGDNVLITTETPIIPENPVTLSGMTGYGLYGAKSYVNCITEIKEISKIYGKGRGADSSKTRGMTIEDVNKITGVITDGTNANLSEVYTAPKGYEYGTELTDHKKGTSYGWTPEAWISASSTDMSDATKAPGYSGKITGYYYQGSNASLKTASSAIRNKLIFGESSSYKIYWLASRGVFANSNNAGFGPGNVGYGRASSCYSDFYSDGGENGYAFGVCPVVYLNSNVSLTSAEPTNGIPTWNID